MSDRYKDGDREREGGEREIVDRDIYWQMETVTVLKNGNISQGLKNYVNPNLESVCTSMKNTATNSNKDRINSASPLNRAYVYLIIFYKM